MEISKFLVLVVAVVVLSSFQTTTAEGENSQVMACMQKLLPCQSYLHNVNPPPPPSCCEPMKEIVEKDAPCLCTVFNNPVILKALKLTKENALDLPKACGANPNVSLCNQTTSSSPPASSGSTSGGSSVPAVSFIGLGFVSALVAIILF